MTKPVEMVLTCGSWQEAQRIADSLLEQKLVACMEMLDVTSRFAWKGAIEENKEVKLIMTTVEHLFDQIQTEVSKLHSYETFVLQQLPITHLNQAAQDWLEDTVK